MAQLVTPAAWFLKLHVKTETVCWIGGLIVPIDGRENQSYFKALVEELCQLEV